jgi:hypothetical protein
MTCLIHQRGDSAVAHNEACALFSYIHRSLMWFVLRCCVSVLLYRAGVLLRLRGGVLRRAWSCTPTRVACWHGFCLPTSLTRAGTYRCGWCPGEHAAAGGPAVVAQHCSRFMLRLLLWGHALPDCGVDCVLRRCCSIINMWLH